MENYAILIAGVLCAGVGGELFVRGLVGLAAWARVSASVVSVTLAAFATSSPELSVAISSAAAGVPQISLGDALGSNVVNVALVLGLVLAVASVASPRESVRRDFPVALLVPGLVGVLGMDGTLSRLDGVALLTVFLVWLVLVLLQARHERSAAGRTLGERSHWRALVLCALGLALLVAAGWLVVAGATGIAAEYGIEEFVIGAMLVALGTSVPEIATALISKLRGHDEVGLGTILGSNIFNGLLIVGVAAVIYPIAIPWGELIPVLLFGIITVAITWPGRGGVIERWRGWLLLAIYTVYIAALAQV